MTLYEKIKQIYPSLTDADFMPNSTIVLQNDSNGKGDYIAQWNHPTLAEPTTQELNGGSNV